MPTSRIRKARCTCKKCGAVEIRSGCSADFKCRACEPIRREDSVQYRAHKAVAEAIRRGELPRPSSKCCTDCGSPATCYDHRDYSRPLEVQAVCRRCNALRGPALTSEARLVNWALAGEFKGLDRDALSADDLALLAYLEERSAVLIGRGIAYEQRKPMLSQYAKDWRMARAMPALAGPIAEGC